jgi:D-alanyl-lipoteichoic acid acyltransferase DltB (MBOAT superfamily)
MLLNSFAFICFLPVVVFIYYLLPHRAQNWFLLFASYFFYACWDWRFLAPLLLSTSIDYWCTTRMEDQIERGLPIEARKPDLVLCLVTNLGLLGFFKYFIFRAGSFGQLKTMIQYTTKTLNFVKWSWFTPEVRALSYSILLYFVPFRGGRPESFIYSQV